MSRTRKDSPWRVWEKTRPWKGGYPPPIGGAWSGIGEMTTRYWRSERAKVKRILKDSIDSPVTRHRHSEKWNRW